jgi:L-asparagine transporter-like permease
MAVYYVYTATMVPLCIYSYYGSWILASYILYLVTNSGCIYYCFFLFLYRSHGLWVVWDWHIFFCCSVQQTEKNRNKKYRKKNVPFCCCTGDTACWLCGIGTFIFFFFFHFVVTQEPRLVNYVGLVPLVCQEPLLARRARRGGRHLRHLF